MSWNGSGTFSRTNGTQSGASTWANARDALNNITASQHDTHDQDLADGINACLAKNGENKPTASFIPNADASYDLGSASLQWRDLFFSGNLDGKKGSDIASATTTDLAATRGLFHDITGTTTITGLGTGGEGLVKIVKFEGALTLTHHASNLILPGGANITTADGDVAVFVSEGSGAWRCVAYAGKNVSGTNGNFSGNVSVGATKKVFLDGGGDTYLIENSANDVSLVVGGTERIGVDSSGILYLNDAARAVSAGAVRVKQTDGTISMRIQNTNASTPSGLNIYFSAAAPDNNTQYFLKGEDNAAERIIIDSDGDVRNHDNSFGAISDEFFKANITPARSQWDDVKALAAAAINWQDTRDLAQYGAAAKRMLGVGAQTIKPISPGLVTEVPEEEDYDAPVIDAETGTPLIGVTQRKRRRTGRMILCVQYSIMQMKGFVAQGENMVRTEALEAQVAELRARLAAAGIA